MKDYDQQIAKTEEKIRQLQNRRKKLLNQKSEEERKARTHRLIERGAILESLLDEPEQYKNEQIKALLTIALQSTEAWAYLHRGGNDKGES